MLRLLREFHAILQLDFPRIHGSCLRNPRDFGLQFAHFLPHVLKPIVYCIRCALQRHNSLIQRFDFARNSLQFLFFLCVVLLNLLLLRSHGRQFAFAVFLRDAVQSILNLLDPIRHLTFLRIEFSQLFLHFHHGFLAFSILVVPRSLLLDPRFLVLLRFSDMNANHPQRLPRIQR